MEVDDDSSNSIMSQNNNEVRIIALLKRNKRFMGKYDVKSREFSYNQIRAILPLAI